MYALGCVLLECLTGSPPFGGGGMVKTLFGHLEGEPPDPCAERPELPPAFGAALLRALAKDAAERPASASEWAQSLGDALGVVAAPELAGAGADRSRDRAIGGEPRRRACDAPSLRPVAIGMFVRGGCPVCSGRVRRARSRRFGAADHAAALGPTLGLMCVRSSSTTSEDRTHILPNAQDRQTILPGFASVPRARDPAGK